MSGAPAALGPLDAGEVPFWLDGERYAVVIPADGRQVCAWARDGRWVYLVPDGLADWCSDAFAELLRDPVGPVDLTVCHRLAVELAPEVYGVPWWTAGRVAASISEHWERYAPWTVQYAFDPGRAPAHRIIASGLAWLRSQVQEERDATKLESMLFEPPKPQGLRRQRAMSVPGFTLADQSASFHAAMAALGDGTG